MKRAENHGAGDAEHGGGGSHPQGKSQCGSGRETRTTA